MAVKHNYATSGPRALYAVGGSLRWVNNENEELVAKQDGYTSLSYVRSKWPTTVFHKKTGANKAIGRLDWTEQQNQAAVAALGDDWTLDHVAAPEPVAEKPANQAFGGDLTALVNMAAESVVLKSRVDELEQAVTSFDAIRLSFEDRIQDLQDSITKDQETSDSSKRVAELEKTVADLVKAAAVPKAPPASKAEDKKEKAS